MLKLDPITAPLRTDEDGVIRVGTTRVTLEVVVHQFQQGAAAEHIVMSFPTLSLSDVYGAIAFYLQNRDAVEAYLRDGAAQEESVRREIDRRNGPASVRDRLLSRRPIGGTRT